MTAEKLREMHNNSSSVYFEAKKKKVIYFESISYPNVFFLDKHEIKINMLEAIAEFFFRGILINRCSLINGCSIAAQYIYRKP